MIRVIGSCRFPFSLDRKSYVTGRVNKNKRIDELFSCNTDHHEKCLCQRVVKEHTRVTEEREGDVQNVGERHERYRGQKDTVARKYTKIQQKFTSKP